MTTVALNAYKDLCLPAKFYFWLGTPAVLLLALAIVVALVSSIVAGGLGLFYLFGTLAIAAIFGGIWIGITWLLNLICEKESVHVGWLVFIGMYVLSLMYHGVDMFFMKRDRHQSAMSIVITVAILAAAIVTMQITEDRDKKEDDNKQQQQRQLFFYG